jgi:hypothetical protein
MGSEDRSPLAHDESGANADVDDVLTPVFVFAPIEP